MLEEKKVKEKLKRALAECTIGEQQGKMVGGGGRAATEGGQGVMVGVGGSGGYQGAVGGYAGTGYHGNMNHLSGGGGGYQGSANTYGGNGGRDAYRSEAGPSNFRQNSGRGGHSHSGGHQGGNGGTNANDSDAGPSNHQNSGRGGYHQRGGRQGGGGEGGSTYGNETGSSNYHPNQGRGSYSPRGGRRGGGRGNFGRGRQYDRHNDRTPNTYTTNWVNNTTPNPSIPDMRGLQPNGTFAPTYPDTPTPVLDPRIQWEPNTLQSAHQYTGFTAQHHMAPPPSQQITLGPTPSQSFSTNAAHFNAFFHSYASSGIPAQGYGQPASLGHAAGFNPTLEILQIRRDARPQGVNLEGAIWHTGENEGMQREGTWVPTAQQAWSESVPGTQQNPGVDYVGYYFTDQQGGNANEDDERVEDGDAEDAGDSADERRSGSMPPPPQAARRRVGVRSASVPPERDVSTRQGV